MKNILMIMMSSVFMMPLHVFARLEKPTNDYGLANAVDISGVILELVNWILGFIAILSVLMIVVSGVMYITSGGDSGTTGKAKDYLTYSIIGLVVAILSYTIVRLISILLGAS